ncbi:unnamed protein product [Protopolystoma xenopodis]|uniref:Uncharacterized protein n=1 Tax=Protopolystoma xenopodis TaxID=117903 RepID=A0A3S4ZZ97_9PLAT|nr:unnamed protein product [Protopolystoma xenopodis]
MPQWDHEAPESLARAANLFCWHLVGNFAFCMLVACILHCHYSRRDLQQMSSRSLAIFGLSFNTATNKLVPGLACSSNFAEEGDDQETREGSRLHNEEEDCPHKKLHRNFSHQMDPRALSSNYTRQAGLTHQARMRMPYPTGTDGRLPADPSEWLSYKTQPRVRLLLYSISLYFIC